MDFKIDALAPTLNGCAEVRKLIEIALEACQVAMRNCAAEEAELFPSHNTVPGILRGRKVVDIKPRFDQHSLIFKNALRSYPYIDTQIGLYMDDSTNTYLDDLEPIGRYNFITSLQGEPIDDYLDLSDELRADAP